MSNLRRKYQKKVNVLRLLGVERSNGRDVFGTWIEVGRETADFEPLRVQDLAEDYIEEKARLMNELIYGFSVPEAIIGPSTTPI